MLTDVTREVFSHRKMLLLSYFAIKYHMTISLPDFEHMTQQRIRKNIILVE